jgi:hypothetical protein
VAAEPGAGEGDPELAYTWQGRPTNEPDLLLRSYTPSEGGSPRLVAYVGSGAPLGVWDTGTGAFLPALGGAQRREVGVRVTSLLTYQRPSDGRPIIAAGSERGQLTIVSGGDGRSLHAIPTSTEGEAVICLAVYEEPTSGRTRLVTG